MLKTVSSITNAIGALNYKGTWDASTNTPALASGVGTKGDYYVVSVAGTTALDGISTWYVGDWAAFNGSVWQRLEGGVDDPALSVKSNSTTGLMQITGPAAGQTRVMTIPDANFTAARTDAAQTFTGTQTFNSAVVINENGDNVNTRIESDTKVNALFVQGSDGFVGVDNGAPIRPLVVRTDTGGDPTYGGDIVINSSAGASSVNATGGLEIKSNTGGAGFGTRLFDYFNGVSDFVFALQRRSNSATWTTRIQVFPSGQVTPGADGTQDLGIVSLRWDDVFAVNGTIQTSDANEKQDIADLDEAERRVAVRAKALLKKFRWKSSVATKGDDARIHFGIIAQELQAAFEAEGLDAGRYGVFTLDEWWEADRIIPAVEAKDAVYQTVVDEDGNQIQVLVSEAVKATPEHTVTDTFQSEDEAPEGAVKKSRMGVRYSELLAFVIASI